MKTNNPWNTSPSVGHSQKNPSDEADSHHPLFFQKILEWTLTGGNYCKEKLNVSPFETVSLTCFLLLLLLQWYIMTCLRGPWPPAWTVALKHICLADRDNLTLSTCEKKKLKHLFPEAGLAMFCKTEGLFILFPHCLSSILPFEFTSLLLLSVSIRQLGIQILIR